MLKKDMPPGFVVWRGPSKLNGQPIVLLASGFRSASTNRKTGAMIQFYIVRDRVQPSQAYKRGGDSAICGDCWHRSKKSGGTGMCYVNTAGGPDVVWKAFKRGSYPVLPLDAAPETFRGRKVRIGAYGDPAAVPVAVWRQVLRFTEGFTGYTHQWRSAPYLKPFVMASCDSEADRTEAASRGWRTFRIRRPEDRLLPGEFVCPSDESRTTKIDCATCMACDGWNRGALRASPVISVHGPSKGAFQV